MYAICALPSYVALSDEALLARVLVRNQLAFAELLRRYRGVLFRCITRVSTRYARVLSSDDVEEIFAELCLGLWGDDLRRLRAFDPARGMKLGSWLGLIATHTTYDFLRRVARRPQHDELSAAPEPTATEPSGLDRLLSTERHDALHTLTAELSARDQDFFALYFGAQEDAEQVARELGISVKTVYSKKNKITNRILRRATEVALAA